MVLISMSNELCTRLALCCLLRYLGISRIYPYTWRLFHGHQGNHELGDCPWTCHNNPDEYGWIYLIQGTDVITPSELSITVNNREYLLRHLGAVSIRKTVLPGMAIPMLKIRRPTGRLIFNMGIPIPGKTVFYIETGPCRHACSRHF